MHAATCGYVAPDQLVLIIGVDVDLAAAVALIAPLGPSGILVLPPPHVWLTVPAVRCLALINLLVLVAHIPLYGRVSGRRCCRVAALDTQLRQFCQSIFQVEKARLHPICHLCAQSLLFCPKRGIFRDTLDLFCKIDFGFDGPSDSWNFYAISNSFC